MSAVLCRLTTEIWGLFCWRLKLCVGIVNKEEGGGDASTLQMSRGAWASLKSSWSASIALQILLYPLCQDAMARNLKDDVILNLTTTRTALTMPPNYNYIGGDHKEPILETIQLRRLLHLKERLLRFSFRFAFLSQKVISSRENGLPTTLPQNQPHIVSSDSETQTLGLRY